MERVYLGLGSNVGDRRAHLAAAEGFLRSWEGGRLVLLSPVYETAPVGPVAQGRFLNAAAGVDTDLSPPELLKVLQNLEMGEGREEPAKREHWGPRTLDVDILLFGQRVLRAGGLTIPHPGMHERWFVLKPLSDIAPQVVHPVLGRTIAELLADIEEARAD